MVQLDEAAEPTSGAAKAGYVTISELSKERVRKAGASVIEAAGLRSESLDNGFRSFKVSSTNMNDVRRTSEETNQLELDHLEGSIKAGRSGEDLLFQVLLDWGLELSMPIDAEQIEDHEVFIVEDGALIACFDDGVTPELIHAVAKRQPLRAVFRDSSFVSDAARINAEQIFREVSPATDVKAI
jgi:adenine-specific DNA-methyltransferase